MRPSPEGLSESGVKVAAAYPGTPSTGGFWRAWDYPGPHVEWSPNEKVALKRAWGRFPRARPWRHETCGSECGRRPSLHLSYTGLRGGLVLVTADDPEMHSSQNEQDNRHYARFAKVPMLEPATARRLKILPKIAFDLSEKFDTPVMVRTTTRCPIPSRSFVWTTRRPRGEAGTGQRPGQNWSCSPPMPASATVVEKRMEDLGRFAETFPGTGSNGAVQKWGSSPAHILRVCQGGDARSLLPEIGNGVPPAEGDDQILWLPGWRMLYVVEELDPFIEEQVRALGLAVEGKSSFPLLGN